MKTTKPVKNLPAAASVQMSPLLWNEFNIRPAEHGMVSAASLFGILVGAVGLGGLSDRFGRKPMFVAEMVIFVARSWWRSYFAIECLDLALLIDAEDEGLGWAGKGKGRRYRVPCRQTADRSTA